jgi:hypothetical protein
MRRGLARRVEHQRIMKCPRPRKQLLLKLGVFLLFGVVVNVAVAWTGSSFSKWPTSSFNEQSSEIAWPAEVPLHWPTTARVLDHHGPLWRLVRHTARRNELKGNSDRLESYLIDQYEFGWPCGSLRSETWGEFVIEGDPLVTTHRFDGHPAPTVWRQGLPTSFGFEVLPLNPRWPEFAINTIFYAAMLWLLWIAPGRIKRFIRVHRGRCPACGFIIAPGTAAASGGPCSECGAASPASWSAKSP